MKYNERMFGFLRGNNGVIDHARLMVFVALLFALVAVGAFGIVSLFGGHQFETPAQQQQRRLDMLNSLGAPSSSGASEGSVPSVATSSNGGALSPVPAQGEVRPPPATGSQVPTVRGQTPSAPSVDPVTQRRLDMLNSLSVQH